MNDATSSSGPSCWVHQSRLIGLDSPKFRFLIVTVGITALGSVLRLYHLSTQELWLDEASSFFKSNTVNWQSHSALFYSLLHVWTQLVGQDEFSLRLLSTLVGSLFVAAACWAGFVIFSPSAGMWSGLIAAVSPIHVYFSQEVRGYALLTLLLLLTYLASWRAVRKGTWEAWIIAVFCGLLSCATHYLAALALLPVAYLLALWSPPRSGPERWGRFAVVAAITAGAVLFWASLRITSQPQPLAGTKWIEQVWADTPPVLAIPITFEIFWLGGQTGLVAARVHDYEVLQFPAVLRWLGVGLLVLLASVVSIPWKDENLGIPRLREKKRWILAQLLLPLLILWMVSLIRPLYVVGRYDLIAYPAFVLLMGLAIAKLRHLGRLGPVLAGTAASLFIAAAATKLNHYYEFAVQNHSKPTAVALHDFVPDGDVVIFTGLHGLPILYYLHRLGDRWENGVCHDSETRRRFWCRMFPRESENQPAVYNVSRVANSPRAVRDDVDEFLAPVQHGDHSVWVVLDVSRDPSGEDVQVRPHDVLLMEEIKRAGFDHADRPLPSIPFLVHFQRS